MGAEGTSCILGLECESGLCIGGKCSVYSDNSPCLSSKECSSNSYCGANLKCNPVKSAGEACITNNECQYGYLCGKQEEKAIKDEVDNTEKNIKNWLRYLYVNESGVAEEIEERIQNLKIAAELEDEDFNEDEFRRYMKKENAEDDDDDFQVEL